MFEGTDTGAVATLDVAIDCTAVAVATAAAIVSYEMETTVKQCRHILQHRVKLKCAQPISLDLIVHHHDSMVSTL